MKVNEASDGTTLLQTRLDRALRAVALLRVALERGCALTPSQRADALAAADGLTAGGDRS